MTGAIAGLAAISVVIVVWGWRHWALRTWRTIAASALALAVAGVTILILPEPFGLMVGSVCVAVVAWLVLTGSRFLRSVSEADYDYAERLRNADLEAAQVLGVVGDRVGSQDATATLDAIIDRLALMPDDSPWARVRDLKMDELRLAQSVLTGGAADPAAAIERQRDVRNRAQDEYRATRRAVSSFW